MAPLFPALAALWLSGGAGAAPLSLPLSRAVPQAPSTVSRVEAIPEGRRLGAVRWVPETPLKRVPALSYTTVYIGTPRRAFKVQVDTGSADLIIPGSHCLSCADRHLFSPNRSRSARLLQTCGDGGQAALCPVDIRYGDGTKVGAWLLRDSLALDTSDGETLCSTVYLDLIVNVSPPGIFSSMGINGILGLGFDAITSNRMTSPLTILMKERGLEDVFALYVGWEVGGSDGVLTIGGVDHRRFKGPLQYTPIVRQTYYCVEVTALSIGGRSVIRNSEDLGLAIVDSGTTYTLLPNAAYTAIQEHLQAHYCHLPFVCGAKATIFHNYCLVAPSLPEGYPTFHWHFRGGIQVNVPPEIYFRKVPYPEGGAFLFCFGLAPFETRPPYTILGDTFMAAAYVVFDRRQMRVGFGTPNHSVFQTTVPPPPPASRWTLPPSTVLGALLLLTATCWLGCSAPPAAPETRSLRPAGSTPSYGTDPTPP